MSLSLHISLSLASPHSCVAGMSVAFLYKYVLVAAATTRDTEHAHRRLLFRPALLGNLHTGSTVPAPAPAATKPSVKTPGALPGDALRPYDVSFSLSFSFDMEGGDGEFPWSEPHVRSPPERML